MTYFKTPAQGEQRAIVSKKKILVYATNKYYDGNYPTDAVTTFLTHSHDKNIRELLMQDSSGKYRRVEIQNNQELVNSIRLNRPMIVRMNYYH